MLDLCFFIYTLLPRSWNETSTVFTVGFSPLLLVSPCFSCEDCALLLFVCLNMCTSLISGLCFRVESLMCFVLVYSFSPLLSVLSLSFCLYHGSQDNILHVYCLYSLCTSLTSPQYKSLSCALDFTACLFHSGLLVSRGKQEAETTDIKTRLF